MSKGARDLIKQLASSFSSVLIWAAFIEIKVGHKGRTVTAITTSKGIDKEILS